MDFVANFAGILLGGLSAGTVLFIVSVGLSQFSNSGLKEFQAFAVDGRRTLAELNKAIKNIDQHPSRLIFGH